MPIPRPAGVGYAGLVEGGRQRLRILVVEDEKTVLLMIGRYLFGRGHVVTAVATGASARTAEGPFDVGVFDIKLGDESGADVAAGLLASKRIRGAVFHTGNSHAPEAEWAELLGPVVPKSAGLQALEQAIRDIAAKMDADHGDTRGE